MRNEEIFQKLLEIDRHIKILSERVEKKSARRYGFIKSFFMMVLSCMVISILFSHIEMDKKLMELIESSMMTASFPAEIID